MPFARNWKIIFLVLGLDAVFGIPFVVVFRQALGLWQSPDSLFVLVAAIFTTAWLLAWALVPLLLTLVLAVLLFGREVLMARPGQLLQGVGIPLVQFLVEYDAGKLRNLRHAVPGGGSFLSWRGPHLAFLYQGREQELGIGIAAAEAPELIRQLVSVTGEPLTAGPEKDAAAAAEREAEAWPAFRRGPGEQTFPGAEGERSVQSPQAGVGDRLSSLMLVLANLVPLFGALYLGWNLGDILVIYWAESAVLGFYNILKMIWIAGWLAVPSILFFVGHFSAFMAVHFLFLYLIFIENASSGPIPVTEVAGYLKTLWPALLGLFVSHGVSFLENFLGRREYLHRSLGEQMKEPYQRILFMHLVVILGGFAVLLLGDRSTVLILVMLAKTVVDLLAHRKLVRAARQAAR